MKTATITFDYPTTRESGDPLPIGELNGVAVELSADLGANFVPLAPVDAPANVITIPDLEAGDWIVRIIAVDSNGVRGAPVDTPFSVAETPPGPVSNVNVALS